MSSNSDFDRWYAARSTRFLMEPRHRLETFGNTLVNYHLISELPDRPGKVRVREGRLEAHQPLVITPHFGEIETEGFSDEARAYLEALRQSERHLRILQYGYHLKSDNYNEYVLTAPIAAVSQRVVADVTRTHDDFAAVMQSVDDPWDVALVELWLREINRSAGHNIKDLQNEGKLF